MIYLCGATGVRQSRVWSDHRRIMLGLVSDRFRIVNAVSTVFRACVVDRISFDLQLYDRSRDVNGIAGGAVG